DLRRFLAGEDLRSTRSAAARHPARDLTLTTEKLLFFAGKGGVGKTTAAASVALQLARERTESRFVLLSVDPAHAVQDVFGNEDPPSNLVVEMIDTRALWRDFRESFGDAVSRALKALTPRGFSLSHDQAVMEQLIDMAPPGADELFAILRLVKLRDDENLERVIVDTAPTGHFLRLLDLPRTAGEWVREFMRLLLRYREILPAGSLGEQLLEASRGLRSFEETLRSENASVIVVTRPDPLVMAETRRLLEELQRRSVRVSALIANAMTPASRCSCDQSRRSGELDVIARLDRPAVIIDRQPQPPVTLEALRALLPLSVKKER
ncbi:MAG TPA: ArsA family ATPase, partial [Thermoanaerobaculia bacterium]|nr:ArsA family ATPase [Thermoanaerobaculia bacterium]